MRRWLRSHSYAPLWLTGRWASPLVGYAAAVALQVIAVLAVAVTVRAIPTFSFDGIPPMLVVALIALIWGEGPSAIATIVGAILLAIVIIPTWQAHAAGGATALALFCAAGGLVSLTAARITRASTADDAWADELDTIVDVITDGILVYDRSGRLLRANRAARAFNSHLERRDYIARPFAERVQQAQIRDAQGRPLAIEEFPVSRALRGEVLTGGEAADTLMRLPDGRDRLLSVSGAPIRDGTDQIVGAVIVNRDVTERRFLEHQAREALNALLAMAEALVLVPDEDAGEESSVPGTRHVGYRLAELTRRVLACEHVAILSLEPDTEVLQPVAVAGFAPADEPTWWAQWAARPRLSDRLEADHIALLRADEALMLDRTQPPFSRQTALGRRLVLMAPLRVGERLTGVLSVDHGGEEHTYTLDEIALVRAAGRLVALVIERERLLREREEARAGELALREANRRMDEFLSIASHELKTPMTVMKGLIQVAERRAQRPNGTDDATGNELAAVLDRVHTLLVRADQQMDRMNRLVEDLLDVSRIQSGRLQLRLDTCDLARIAHDATQEQRAMWPARTIELHLPDDPAIVQADAERLIQVVANYLTNALKYSPHDRPVAVSVRREGAWVCVRVRDEGPGIPAEAHEHIWDRFYRVPGIEEHDGANSSAGGLGMGLYISRTLIEQHGGRVGVESAPGSGSTFWLALPADQDSAAES